MDQKLSWDFESKLIDRLRGRLMLLQPEEERVAEVRLAIQQVLAENRELFSEEGLELNSEEGRQRYVKKFLSYGVMEDLLCDYEIEDIIINSLNPIYIHHSQRGFVSTGRFFKTQKELELFVRKLILFGGKSIGSKKIIDLELPNLAGRVNIAMSAFGPQLTITKTKLEPLSILDLISQGSLNYEVAAQLWLYLEGLSIRPANIVIGGGPGTGKTTLLNALFSFVPSSHRLVVIEDTLELNTFLWDSCSRLECDDDVTLADLVRNSLRMRPERIVVGEVRGPEAQDMITAVNVGKYCIGTIHALTCREAILRLENEPMNVPEILVNLVDVFVILKRYHINERLFRVVDEVSETSGMEQKTVLLSQIYKYDYEKKEIKTVSTSTVFRDKLAQQAGLTPRDIIDEVYLRSVLLKTMHEKKMTTMKEVTSMCRAYSEHPSQTTKDLLGVDRKRFFNSKEK